MPDDHRDRDRLLRPLVPLVNVQIGAAEAGFLHADEHIVQIDFGLRHVFEPETRAGFTFDEGFHDRGRIKQGWVAGKTAGREALTGFRQSLPTNLTNQSEWEGGAERHCFHRAQVFTARASGPGRGRRR